MLRKFSLQINQKTVYYWVRNPDCHRTLLIVHGLKGNHRGFTQFSAYLEDWRTIFVALPGYEYSEPMSVEHSPINYARFIEQFCRELHIDHCCMLGYSLGGVIASMVCANQPKLVDKLILVSPLVPSSSWSKLQMRAQLTVARLLPLPLRQVWLTSKLLDRLGGYILIKTVSVKRRRALIENGQRVMNEQIPSVIVDNLTGLLETNIYNYTPLIKCPTLLISGQEDVLTPLSSQQPLLKSLKQAELRVLPLVGHLAPLEMPGTLATIARQFLNKAD